LPEWIVRALRVRVLFSTRCGKIAALELLVRSFMETAAEASMKQFEGVLNDVTAVPWRSDAVPRERT
jgi:hypothetical protein